MWKINDIHLTRCETLSFCSCFSGKPTLRRFMSPSAISWVMALDRSESIGVFFTSSPNSSASLEQHFLDAFSRNFSFPSTCIKQYIFTLKFNLQKCHIEHPQSTPRLQISNDLLSMQSVLKPSMKKDGE